MKQKIVSGIRPTKQIHIGNYLGALRHWVKLQDEYECLFFIADLHALTTEKNPGQYTEDLAKTYLAAGLDPEKTTIFVQSQVPQCTELAWIFNCLMPVSELERMTQYKDKCKKSPNAGLLTYPSLMAADILLYKAHGVPVGKDQEQHVEITRKFARKFNQAYGKIFPEPKVILSDTPELMSLIDPEKKMSKSEPKGCLFLGDSEKAIKEKIQKAVSTESGIRNLIALANAFDADLKPEPNNYAEFKKQLAQVIIKELLPIQEHKAKIKNINQVLEDGRKIAQKIAQETLREVKNKINL
ncbi:MAG: tryptophan--tRNA ligase [bacterium]